MSSEVILCLGTNLPERQLRLSSAIARLAAHVAVADYSEAVESADVSGIGADYLNVVVRCFTTLSLNELRELISRIEAAEGRTPQAKLTGCMPIDIDVVMYGGEVVSLGDYQSDFFSQAYQLLTVKQQ